jgi:hypothetical protein
MASTTKTPNGTTSHQGEIIDVPIENPATATAAIPVANRALPN